MFEELQKNGILGKKKKERFSNKAMSKVIGDAVLLVL